MNRLNHIPASRTAALGQFRQFLPCAGSAYADDRNHDLGPERRTNVSGLSPFIRHGLLDEAEIIRAVLDWHGQDRARKFIEEVCWRTYFKGWLEARPEVWRRYRRDLDTALARLEKDGGLDDRYAAAVQGRTGIACFDHWAQELVSCNYLHNHARMWFACIWVFTLELPWVLGADFFLRYLLDGDAASNTLSWRWVCGLHTQGKTYLATSSNIARFSGGRFPQTEGLAATGTALQEAPLPAAQPLRGLLSAQPDLPTGLLITDDDCGGERVLEETGLTSRACAGFSSADHRSPLPVAEAVRQFSTDALRDGLTGAGRQDTLPTTLLTPAQILEWAGAHGLRQILMRYVPQGPSEDVLHGARDQLEARDIRLVEIRRPWDEAFWPHATGGYFKLKKRIPAVLRGLGFAV